MNDLDMIKNHVVILLNFPVYPKYGMLKVKLTNKKYFYI